MRTSSRQQPVPKHQADAYVDQANPVSGTKYEWSSDGTQTNKLGALKNVRIIGIAAKVTWTVQPTPLEAHVTIDGNALVFSLINPVSTTWYFPSMTSSETLGSESLGTIDRPQGRPFLFEGRNVKIEVETTGGTVQNLDIRVKYAKW